MRQFLGVAAAALLSSWGAACRGGADLKLSDALLDDPSASEIVERMRETYASCKTYQDRGRGTRRFVSDSGERVETIGFSTAFVRPMPKI